MKALNALGVRALRSGQSAKTDDIPDDLQLDERLAIGFIAAANAHMRLVRARQQSEDSKADILPHYVFNFQQGIVAQKVLDLAVDAFKAVGWDHTVIVANSLVVAREPYSVPKGRGGLGAEPTTRRDSRQMTFPLPGMGFMEPAELDAKLGDRSGHPISEGEGASRIES